MNVLVDTCIWSEGFRRKRRVDPTPESLELAELINEARVVMIGPVRQEILCGIRSKKDFVKLRDHLRAFQDWPLEEEDYEAAADLFDFCRAKGIQGSSTDFLICAVAHRRELSLFTTDKDFHSYAEFCSLRFHEKRKDF